jgi:Pectate lyase superfamily protein
MKITARISHPIRRTGLRILGLTVAGFVLVPVLSGQATAQAAQVSQRDATARIQALIDNPVNGVVNLPAGTFTIRPALRLRQGETIIGHNTTLKVAASSGDYAAVLAGASAGTDLSGLTVKGVTFDQNASANPIRNVQALYGGKPRFVVLVIKGTGISITGNKFRNTNNVDTVVTGSATSQVTISGNTFTGYNAPMHDHSTVYTSGIGTAISGNTFTGKAMYDSAAIEVHGAQVSVTGNKVKGYFRAANIVASNTTFSRNTITAAGNPVDLWSVVAPGLHDVAITGNVLNRDLPYWARVLASRGLPMRPAPETKQVIRDAISTYPFQDITIRGNRG